MYVTTFHGLPTAAARLQLCYRALLPLAPSVLHSMRLKLRAGRVPWQHRHATYTHVCLRQWAQRASFLGNSMSRPGWRARPLVHAEKKHVSGNSIAPWTLLQHAEWLADKKASGPLGEGPALLLLKSRCSTGTSFPTGSRTPRGRGRCRGARVWTRAVDGFRHNTPAAWASRHRVERRAGVEKLDVGPTPRSGACRHTHSGSRTPCAQQSRSRCTPRVDAGEGEGARRRRGCGCCWCCWCQWQRGRAPKCKQAALPAFPSSVSPPRRLTWGEGIALHARHASPGSQRAARRIWDGQRSRLASRLESVGLHADQPDRPCRCSHSIACVGGGGRAAAAWVVVVVVAVAAAVAVDVVCIVVGR